MAAISHHQLISSTSNQALLSSYGFRWLGTISVFLPLCSRARGTIFVAFVQPE